MGFANEYLWKGRARTGTIVHRLTNARIPAGIVLDEGGLFAVQQRFGGAAIAAPRTGKDFDAGGHVNRFVERLIIWEVWGHPQPGRTPARRPRPLLPATAPARRHPA